MTAIKLVETEADDPPTFPARAHAVPISFIDAETNKPVSVNALWVRCVRDHDSRGHTRIEFSKDHWVAVKADVHSVARKLFGAA